MTPGNHAEILPGKAPQPFADAVIEAYKKDIDRSLLRQSLRLSVTERFEELMELQRFAEELRNAPRGTRDD